MWWWKRNKTNLEPKGLGEEVALIEGQMALSQLWGIDKRRFPGIFLNSTPDCFWTRVFHLMKVGHLQNTLELVEEWWL